MLWNLSQEPAAVTASGLEAITSNIFVSFFFSWKCGAMALGCEQASVYRLNILREFILFTIISNNLNSLQVNLCQKLLFLHQLTHRLFIELQVQYMKMQSSNLGRTCCVKKLFLTFRTIFVHNMFSPCSAKRRDSDKDLPVWTVESFIFLTLKLDLWKWSLLNCSNKYTEVQNVNAANTIRLIMHYYIYARRITPYAE